ncbi:MAG TPA: L,D-transpeptidase [Thermoanaerobaculia bacterium]|jgi:L,D-transpeptidase YbiS|nr:L,D-transpeptidase [Thermoanaerobaculia bacterium]
MTQPSIDSLARAAFVEAAPRRPRLDSLIAPLALAMSVAAVMVAGVALLSVVGAWAGGYRYEPLREALAHAPSIPTAAGASDPKNLRKLEAESKKLLASLERRTPRSSYVVVDRTNNLLYLRSSGEVALQAVCSAGSGSILKEPNGKRTWVFDTPQGQFKVISILKNPIWRKPDWAFIEEGEPIPTNINDRFEPGMLGEYGLYFGDGYLIHGTLYERLLGRNVTHGCIRLGKKDLRELVQATRLGTQIYIF